MKIQFASIPSPLGTLHIATTESHLLALAFENYEETMRKQLTRRYGTRALNGPGDPLGVVPRLNAYFSGEIRALDNLPVDGGGTPFQRRVWEALRSIPAAETASYGEIASRIGSPGASRAVGRANAVNPIAIVVPCHRVIGASGTLTGYGGGLERKEWLLAHERMHSS